MDKKPGSLTRAFSAASARQAAIHLGRSALYGVVVVSLIVEIDPSM